MNKVLVTGATGFIGQAVCRVLVDAGYEVHGLSRSKQTFSTANGIHWHVYSDVDDQRGIEAALQGMDAVIHLAARVHQMNDRIADPLAEYRKVNTQGTKLLAKAAVKASVRRFIFVSSIKASEDAKALAEDPYGLSKREAEAELHKISEASGLETVIFRPCLVYGPEVKANFLSLLKMVQAPIPLPFAKLQNRRSFLYVNNFADAILCSLSANQAVGRIFAVSDCHDVSTTELIQTVAWAAGVKARMFYLPQWTLRWLGTCTGRSSAIERLVGSLTVDTSTIRNELVWTPPFTFQEGIMSTVQWYLGTEGNKGKHV
ncbi:NAD-dependent epimerase/dehydratase family protein [Paenibacillus periandrae]|uniref:NAD-dependent epimerase/dehydratase family protein n=1 Tax=Paenibacillus periandrae TaxID=1761741 RepID=UPI001F08D398|nr:NAD-dependent epimerase/dehydratase family protein [Paenibacillus periandrae]